MKQLKIVLTLTVKLLMLTAIVLVLFHLVYDAVILILHAHNAKAAETHDVEVFFDKSYTAYNGGENAVVFFDEYADIASYKDIAFHYVDGERKISFYKQWTIFVLDVYYEKEKFLEVSNEILFECVGETAESFFETYDGKQRVPLSSGCQIRKETSIFSENTAVVLFDPRYNTIRYAYLCYVAGEEYNVNIAISRSLRLNGNYDDQDWVFDYSDIALKEDTDN